MKKKFDYTKLKTVAACFKARGLDPKVLPHDKRLTKKHNNQLLFEYIRTIVTEAINMDEDGKVWEPNWLDDNEYKYRFWGWVVADKKHPSGLGFSGSYGVLSYSISGLGSRLYLRDYKRFDHMRTHFLKVIQDEMFS